MRVVVGEDLFLLRDDMARPLEAHRFEIRPPATASPPGTRTSSAT